MSLISFLCCFNNIFFFTRLFLSAYKHIMIIQEGRKGIEERREGREGRKEKKFFHESTSLSTTASFLFSFPWQASNDLSILTLCTSFSHSLIGLYQSGSCPFTFPAKLFLSRSPTTTLPYATVNCSPHLGLFKHHLTEFILSFLSGRNFFHSASKTPHPFHFSPASPATLSQSFTGSWPSSQLELLTQD